MKIFYQDDYATIYHGDCREILPQLPKVDLVLTDPPYGIGWDKENATMSAGRRRDGSQRTNQTWRGWSEKGYACGNWDKERSEIVKHLPALAPAIIWGGNYYADALPASGGWLVWDKDVGMPTLSKCELAWTNISEHVEIFKCVWAGYRKAEPTSREHPTQKPERLMVWCINLASANTILDPFMGSGTTLVAAKQLGRKAIGIEIEERYCEIAATRLSNEPNPLFTEPQQQPKEQELKW